MITVTITITSVGGAATRFIYPHNGVQSSLCVCVSVYPSLCISVYLSVWFSASIFGNHKSAARNFPQRMRLQATG